MTRPASAPPPLAALDGVATPALIVDIAAAQRNHRLACAGLGLGQSLRPHFKAHKCTALARLQLAGGVTGVCCQTSWEAVTLAAAGISDIMLTNQVVDRTALDELALAARTAKLSVLVDSPVHIERLAETARRAAVRFDVLVEVDLGMKRCGVPPQSDGLIDLARAAAGSDVLTFIGIQAYDGHVAGLADPDARRQAAGKSIEQTRLAVERLRFAGLPVAVVAGASTGHLPFIRDMDSWTDIQAGSYVVMDGAYSEYPDLAFEPALFALATVIHRSSDRAVLDIGLKHLAVDRGNPAWAVDPAVQTRLSDEHTVVAVGPAAGLAVGDRTFMIPRHVDPTINLHSELWFFEDGRVWSSPVDGRMPARREPPIGLRASPA